MPLNICIKHKLHLLLNFAKRPDIQWLAIVFLSFVVMLCQFYRRLIVPVNTPVPLLTVLADSMRCYGYIDVGYGLIGWC